MPDKDLPFFSNILLIAGAGRNTGKTSLACSLIEQFSKDLNVIALKISPHFHTIHEKQKIIEQTSEFTVIEEQVHNNKDSSKMLLAGAEKVFYIQVKQDKLSKAFNSLLPIIKKGPVICESGGLNQIIRPGLFLFLHRDGLIPENKKPVLKFNPILIDLFNKDNKFQVDDIYFSENSFYYKTET